MKAAADKGRRAGNLGLRDRQPDAIRKAATARHDAYASDLIASADSWLPIVRRLRPPRSWPDVVQILNRTTGQNWSVDRLRRAIRSLVRQGLADAALLERSPRKPVDDRLFALVSGIAMANPGLSLRDIAAQLEAMHERTPRGGRRWNASSVKNLLDRASL